MIVTREDYLQAMRRQELAQLDPLGFIKPTPQDATVIARYAQRMFPLIVQAEALFWENGGKVETPKQAAMALALHHVEPEMFEFPDCKCGKQLQQGPCHFQPDQPCSRQAWLKLLHERAVMPSAVVLPEIPTPQRGRR